MEMKAEVPVSTPALVEGAVATRPTIDDIAVGFPALSAILSGLITFGYSVALLYAFLTQSSMANELVRRVGPDQAEIEYAFLIIARLLVGALGALFIFLGSSLMDRKNWSRVSFLIVGIVAAFLGSAALVDILIFQPKSFGSPDAFLIGLIAFAASGICWTVGLTRRSVRAQFFRSPSHQSKGRTNDTFGGRIAVAVFIFSGVLTAYLTGKGNLIGAHTVSIVACLLLLFLPLCYYTLTLFLRSAQWFALTVGRRPKPQL